MSLIISAKHQPLATPHITGDFETSLTRVHDTPPPTVQRHGLVRGLATSKHRASDDSLTYSRSRAQQLLATVLGGSKRKPFWRNFSLSSLSVGGGLEWLTKPHASTCSFRDFQGPSTDDPQPRVGSGNSNFSKFTNIVDVYLPSRPSVSASVDVWAAATPMLCEAPASSPSK